VQVWSAFQGLLIPFLAVFTAILIGSILILMDGRDPITAFEGLFDGAFLEPRGLLTTFRNMVPLVLSGLAVAFAFKSGLFNIGVQGQLIVGAVMAAWVGFAVKGLPPVLHVTLAMLAAMLVGGLWASIAGVLKAYADAHEVITTIMLNYIAIQFATWLISTGSEQTRPGPLASPQATADAIARTPEILKSARLPVIYTVPPNFELHAGIFIAIIMSVVIMFVLYRTTFGFQLRMNGYNPTAAQYAGVNVRQVTILTMFIAGCLAGMAGQSYFAPQISAGRDGGRHPDIGCQSRLRREPEPRPGFQRDHRRVPGREQPDRHQFLGVFVRRDGRGHHTDGAPGRCCQRVDPGDPGPDPDVRGCRPDHPAALPHQDRRSRRAADPRKPALGGMRVRGNRLWVKRNLDWPLLRPLTSRSATRCRSRSER